MATSTDSVSDHMLQLRMKLVQQKLQNERERITRPQSVESNNNGNDLENQAKLQQAMLRRQELLDRIRREQLLNDDNKRPRTYSANRRRYTPSPLPPPSRRSLPAGLQLSQNPYYQQMPDSYRSKPEAQQVKHIIEHRVKEPSKQYLLPPITTRGQAVVVPPALPPQPPAVISMQQPNPPPAIIQGPAPQHIIHAGNPGPVIHNLGTPQPDNRGLVNKGDIMEMMLVQNAQLQQMMMHQTLMNNDPRVAPRLAPGPVHHHHYTPPPPSQPAVHHYTTLPAMGYARDTYPFSDYNSAYKGPAYAFAGYDEGSNYYAYH